MESKRGAFIVIEGLDRSGKSTQAGLLCLRLQQSGHVVQHLKFPDRSTPIGGMIDSYLRSQSELDDRAVHLLFSANRWELAISIEATLAAGATVVCDRYAFSGVAFSAGKGLSYEWCRAPEIGLPAPDATLFLDLNPAVAARTRGGFGAERYEREDLQARVRAVFQRIGDEMGKRWIILDAAKSVEDVSDAVWAEVQKVFTHSHGPIYKLWAKDLIS